VDVAEEVLGTGPEVRADPSETALWQRWRTARDPLAREQLIDAYSPFAMIMAKKLYRGRYGDELPLDDYVQFALVGMMEALERFDPDKGASFKTYSAMRIRGAVLDGVMSFSERHQQIAAWRQLQVERAESLADGQPATASGFRALADIALGLALGYVLEGSGMYQGAEDVSPDNGYARMEVNQLRSQLQSLVERLPPAERYVIKAYYLNQIPFVDIAADRKVSKVRISQLHSQAIGRLRLALSAVAPCDMAW
jgi:RNA polymerase sigma factor FliA